VRRDHFQIGTRARLEVLGPAPVRENAEKLHGNLNLLDLGRRVNCWHCKFQDDRVDFLFRCASFSPKKNVANPRLTAI